MKLSEAIRLTGFRNQNTEPFMQDFIAGTENSPVGKGRLYKGVLISVEPFGGKIHLGDITTLTQGQKGLGTAALNFLKELSNKHNVTLAGTAKAYSKDDRHVQSSDRLLRWYSKHGFKQTGGDAETGYDMVYLPKRQH